MFYAQVHSEILRKIMFTATYPRPTPGTYPEGAGAPIKCFFGLAVGGIGIVGTDIFDLLETAPNQSRLIVQTSPHVHILCQKVHARFH